MAVINFNKDEATETQTTEKKPVKEKLANGLTYGQTLFLTLVPVAGQLIVAGATVAAAVLNAQAAASNLQTMQMSMNNTTQQNNE